jgi:hypothetical protein
VSLNNGAGPGVWVEEDLATMIFAFDKFGDDGLIEGDGNASRILFGSEIDTVYLDRSVGNWKHHFYSIALRYCGNTKPFQFASSSHETV